MTIPVFYTPMMSATTKSFSPSAGKPKLVVEDWLKRGLDITVLSFEPLTRDHIIWAHWHRYVNGVLDLKLANGFGNRSPRVAESLPYTSGSMVAAAMYASTIQFKRDEWAVACSPSSGFHHAGYSNGHGYCTFNGLMIAALSVLYAGTARKVGIIDFDQHHGDGTEDIIVALQLQDKVLVFDGREDDFLDNIGATVQEWKQSGVGLILYQAGADQHKDDPLGGTLTTEDMRYRDELVFQAARTFQVPIAWNLAGGYQTKPKLLELHRNTMIECIKAFPRRDK